MGATTIGGEALVVGRHEAAGEVRQLPQLVPHAAAAAYQGLHATRAGIATARSGLMDSGTQQAA